MINLKVPKKYQERFCKLETESNLIDNCKYLLYYADGWGYCMGYNDICSCIPVRNKSEALEFLKDSVRKES